MYDRFTLRGPAHLFESRRMHRLRILRAVFESKAGLHEHDLRWLHERSTVQRQGRRLGLRDARLACRKLPAVHYQ
jgi:hypothetical protein